MSGISIFDAKSVRGDEPETRSAKKRQAYERNVAPATWRLKSQEVCKRQRAARTAMLTRLAKGAVQIDADVPRICSCDGRGVRKPFPVVLPVASDSNNDGCYSCFKVTSTSTNELLEGSLDCVHGVESEFGRSMPVDARVSAEEMSSNACIQELQSLVDLSEAWDFEFVLDSLALGVAKESDDEPDWSFL